MVPTVHVRTCLQRALQGACATTSLVASLEVLRLLLEGGKEEDKGGEEKGEERKRSIYTQTLKQSC